MCLVSSSLLPHLGVTHVVPRLPVCTVQLVAGVDEVVLNSILEAVRNLETELDSLLDRLLADGAGTLANQRTVGEEGRESTNIRQDIIRISQMVSFTV
jgi:hypothetical protein